MLLSLDLELPIAGRKHFFIPPADEKVYKPFLRTFQNVNKKDDRQEGKRKYPNINNEENKTYIERRHFEVRNGEEKYPTPSYIKTFDVANKQSNKEYSLEKIIVSKRRIQSVKQQRNFIDFSNPGDKSYKNPECTEGFFKEGGLIPGSSNAINFKKTVGKKANNFYQTLDINTKTLDPKKLWSNKVANEELSFQTDYVKNLKAWDKNFKKDMAPPPKIVENQGKSPVKAKEVKKPVKK